MPTTSAFAKRLAAVAQEQHAKFQFMNEADPLLCRQIEKWTTDIGATFKSCTAVPWSAVFISWCVQKAGATANELRFPRRIRCSFTPRFERRKRRRACSTVSRSRSTPRP